MSSFGRFSDSDEGYDKRGQGNGIIYGRLLCCCIRFVNGNYKAKKSQFNREIALCLMVCNLVKTVKMCTRK